MKWIQVLGITILANLTNSGREGQTEVRCATYARYSSDSQRPSSIEDQNRNNEGYAASKSTLLSSTEGRVRWTVLPEFQASDTGISGASLYKREGLKSLIDTVKRKPRPFDCLLIDDTSRLGRRLADVLDLADTFEFHGALPRCSDSYEGGVSMRLQHSGVQ